MLKSWDRTYWISILIALDAGYQSGHSSWVVNVEKSAIQTYLERSMGDLLTTSNKAEIWSTFVTIRVVGLLVGAEVGGLIMDRYGRKMSMRLTSLTMMIGCFLQSLPAAVQLQSPSPLWWGMYLGRFLQTFGVGFAQANSITFITEISLPEERGTNGAKYNLFSAVGALVTVVLGIPQVLQYTSWNFSTLLAASTSIITFSVSWLIPDSPKFLVDSGQQGRAAFSLMYYQRIEMRDATLMVTKIDEDLGKENYYTKQRSSPRHSSSSGICACISNSKLFNLCTRPDLKKPLLLLLGVSAARSLSGYNIIFSYSTFALEQSGVPTYISIWGTICVVIIRFLVSLSLGAVMDRIGRRLPLIISSWIMLACFVVLAISTQISHVNGNLSTPLTGNTPMNEIHTSTSSMGLSAERGRESGFNKTTMAVPDPLTTSGIFALIAVVVWPIAYVAGVGTVTRILVSEIFGQQDRATANRLYVQLDSLLSLVYTFAYLPLFELVHGYTYLLIIMPLLPLNIALSMFLPETKGQSTTAIVKTMSMRRMRNKSEERYTSDTNELTPLLKPNT